MSAVISSPPLDRLDTDALIEAVLRAPDARTRAAIIAVVVQDLCAAVEYLHIDARPVTGCTAAELDAIRHLSSAAHAHHLRTSLGVEPAPAAR